MEKSTTITEIAKALANFQRKVATIKKTEKILFLRVNTPHWKMSLKQ